jgi:hypothetical protein
MLALMAMVLVVIAAVVAIKTEKELIEAEKGWL